MVNKEQIEFHCCGLFVLWELGREAPSGEGIASPNHNVFHDKNHCLPIYDQA